MACGVLVVDRLVWLVVGCGVVCVYEVDALNGRAVKELEEIVCHVHVTCGHSWNV